MAWQMSVSHNQIEYLFFGALVSLLSSVTAVHFQFFIFNLQHDYKKKVHKLQIMLHTITLHIFMKSVLVFSGHDFQNIMSCYENVM
jgi:hypothetical protein